MTDTIEPTEEQRRAAASICRRQSDDHWGEADERDIAHLLAERERKLRESYVRIGVSTGQAERDALRAERDANIRLRVAAEDRARMLQGLANIAHTESDTLRADLARANDERVHANGYLLAAQKSEMAMKGQLADARARVAELEAVTDEISDMRAQLHIADTREAQHLADIKALQILLHCWVSSYVGGRHGEDARSLVDVTYRALTGAPLAHYDDAKVPCQNTTTDSAGRSTCLLALGHDGLCEWSPRRKHYDDAKADAPAEYLDKAREVAHEVAGWPDWKKAGFQPGDTEGGEG